MRWSSLPSLLRSLPGWLLSLGGPDALEPLILPCPVQLLSLSTLQSPWASLFMLPMGYFGIPEVVCFHVGKFIGVSLGLVLSVFSLRIFPSPKVVEIISCIILQTMYYFALFFFWSVV